MHHPRVRGKTAFGGDANVHFSLQPMAFQQPRRHDRLGETRVGMYPGRARHRLSQSLAKNHPLPRRCQTSWVRLRPMSRSMIRTSGNASVAWKNQTQSDAAIDLNYRSRG